jgi:hypothetical protein
MNLTIASLAAEDAADVAHVEKDLPFLRTVGEGDGFAVLPLIEKPFKGGEDPRLVAAIDALPRVLGRVATKC